MAALTSCKSCLCCSLHCLNFIFLPIHCLHFYYFTKSVLVTDTITSPVLNRWAFLCFCLTWPLGKIWHIITFYFLKYCFSLSAFLTPFHVFLFISLAGSSPLLQVQSECLGLAGILFYMYMFFLNDHIQYQSFKSCLLAMPTAFELLAQTSP